MGKNKLVVTIAYYPGYRNKSLEDLASAGHQIHVGDYAFWAAEPIIVRKEFKANELPGTFKINVETPKGKNPVFPKMLFIRRELVSTGEKPSDEKDLLKEIWSSGQAQGNAVPSGGGVEKIPDGAKKLLVRGKPNVEDLLLDIDSPSKNFGASPRDNRVRKAGETTNPFLVKFNLSEVPKGAKILRADLLFYVWDPHNETTSKNGIYEVKTAWKEGEATFNAPSAGSKWAGGASFKIGSDTPAQPVSTVIVRPDQGSDEAVPPIEYKADITSLVKKWVDRSSPNNGIALQTIPDYDTDGGANSRFQVIATERANQPECTPALQIFFE